MIQKIRIEIELSCVECGGWGKLTGLEDPRDPGSAYECDCDSCNGTGFQTKYISIEDFRDLLNG